MAKSSFLGLPMLFLFLVGEAQITTKGKLVTIAQDGAWTWYNDERTCFWNGHLVVGYVHENGASMMAAYDLEKQKTVYNKALSTWKEVDDHNNPAFLPLSNQKLLSIYAKHNTDKQFNTRLVNADFSLEKEQTIRHSATVTYTNLYQLSKEEGKIYNFFRGQGWNPNLVQSTDNGQSWSDPTMVFLSGDKSTRPYVKYSSNDIDRVDLFYTDGHPRNEPENNVYHVFYKDGAFHTSDGKVIRSLSAIEEQPLRPKDGTLIFDGSGKDGRGWVHDFESNPKGDLAGVFISSPDGDAGLDLRYHYARFSKRKKSWKRYEVGFAGPHLYVPENHYAGGICIDPDDLNVVYLSSKLDPKTGESNGTNHYQIYKGVTKNKGKKWSFQQITFDQEKDHLRPTIPRNRPKDLKSCVVWFTGKYDTYKIYDSDMMVWMESSKK